MDYEMEDSPTVINSSLYIENMDFPEVLDNPQKTYDILLQ